VPKLLRLLLIALVGGVCLAVGVAGLAFPVNAMINGATSSIPNPLLDIFKQQAEVSTVYAADGSVLAVLSAAINRTPVTLDQVPDVLIDAVVDTEDSRFYTHGGIDVKSTVRALASDVKSGATVQGASTITQQLVKTVLNTPEKTLSRKVKDAVIAQRLEQRYTKNQILEAYLNAIYFGNGAYGVQAAAQTYFNENVEQVTTVQAALLAGMIRDPEGYDPILNPNDSRARRNFVLQRMVIQGDIPQAEATTLSAEPIPTAITVPKGAATTSEDYYVEQVKQILLNQSSTLGNTYSERYNELFEGGLKIYTNLDPRLQSDADHAVASDFPAYDANHGFGLALASIDPSNGDVRAIVGGPGFNKLQYDLATQNNPGRQPGSGFKLFTLLAAYEAGDNPNDTVDGSQPCAVPFGNDISLLKSPIHNDANESYGVISVTTALANSVNCAFIRIAATIGLQKVADMAHRLGLSENFPLHPSMVIGSEETSVLEMANAYATVADDGVYHAPTFINHIVDSTGDTIFTESTAGKRVLAPQIAREAIQTMRAVVEYGTGVAANLPNREVAGKTGTTESNTDAWFNGITPQLTTSVWMGDINGRLPMVYPNTLVAEFGADTPTQVWRDYTAAALANAPAINFALPTGTPPGTYIGGPPSSVFLGPTGSTLYTPSYTAPASGGFTTPTGVPPATAPPPSYSAPPPTQPTITVTPPTRPHTSSTCVTIRTIPGRTFPPICT
jgi:penicillin-binding protein 1A